MSDIILVMSIILILIRVNIDYNVIFDYDAHTPHMLATYLHNREKYFLQSIANMI